MNRRGYFWCRRIRRSCLPARRTCRGSRVRSGHRCGTALAQTVAGVPRPTAAVARIQCAAFEDRALSVGDHAAIVRAAGKTRLVPVDNAFHALRAVKSEHEFATIAEAARITDAAFVAATSAAEPGVSETALAWRIESAMHDLGADGPGFPVIVAAGPHSARPHHDPSDRPIQQGEPVVIDMGAMVGGYSADLTRTICLGQAPPAFIDRYNTVLRAQRRALAEVRAAMSGREADAVAREELSAAGYGDQFLHGLGHGVGLNIHEFPSLGRDSDDILEPGHVVTIEPGCISRAGVASVSRIFASSPRRV